MILDRVYLYVNTHIHHAHIPVRVHVCILYMYICVYVCVYISIYTHTHKRVYIPTLTCRSIDRELSLYMYICKITFRNNYNLSYYRMSKFSLCPKLTTLE